MANGDVKQDGSAFRQWALQDGTGATDSGTWVDIGPFSARGMLEVSGITTATVQVYGSNAPTIPANATDGSLLYATNITSNGIVPLGDMTRWVKAKISAWTSGTVRADLVGHKTHT